MKAKRQVYLHIGLDKTGTTSIQRAMYRSAELLRSVGVEYPTFSSNHFQMSILLSEAPETFSASYQRIGVRSPEHWDTKKLEMEEEFSKLKHSKCNSLVLSAEYFCEMDEIRVRALQDRAMELSENPVIIIYIRDPISWVTSRFLQSMRGGYTWEQSVGRIANGLSRYRENIERYDRIFGNSNVDIRIFESAISSAGGVVADFLAAIGARADLLGKMDVKRANAGSNAEQALILDAINRSRPKVIDGKLSPERDRKIVGRLAHIEGTKLDISSSLVDNFGSELTSLYAWVARRVPETAELYSLERASSRSRNSLDEGAALKSAFDQICESFNDLGVQATKLAVEKAYWKAAYHVAIGEGATARDLCINALALDPENARIKNLMKKVDLEN